MSLVKPVEPVSMPSDLIGVPNGSVPASLLTLCGIKSSYSPFAELLMHHLASRSLKALMAAAYAEIPGFRLISATSTMRSYGAQVVAFDGTKPSNRTSTNGRYVPQELWSDYVGSGGKFVETDVKSWLGKLWKRRAGTAMAAVPGRSNHGFGIAIDFASIPVVFTIWLIGNAARFGFSGETQSEDWHWRYVAGDRVPQETLEYEHAQNPSPPTPGPGYDEDMPTLYRDSRFWNVFFVNGDVTTLGPKLNDSYIARGVVQIVDTHDQSLISYMRKAQIKTGQLVPSDTPAPFNAPADLVGV